MKHSYLLTSFVLLLITSSWAFPRFVSLFPNGDAGFRPGSGITCQHLGHENCVPGAPRNPFGVDWAENGEQWDKELCEKDSDGDGLTNGEELGDPCCEWTLDNPTDLRQDQLSHPGDRSDDGAKSAPGCEKTTTPPPTTTTAPPTTTTTTTTTAAPPTTAGTNTDSTAAPPTTDVATTSTGSSPTTTAPATMEATSGATTASPTTTEATGSNVTPTPSPTADDDDGVCFPAHATVQLEDGKRKRMDQVEIGDRVQIGAGQFSEVFMFTHKIPDVYHEFVTIRTGTAEKIDASITLTKGHFIYASGKSITADQVKVGDTLELHDGRVSEVVDIECATFKGLYNPQTTHGDMIVDGVRVSTYTTVVHSRLAHSLLAPLRALYRWLGWSPQVLEKGAPRIARILS